MCVVTKAVLSMIVAVATVVSAIEIKQASQPQPAREPVPEIRAEAPRQMMPPSPGGPVISSFTLTPVRLDSDGVCRTWRLNGTATGGQIASFFGQPPVNGAMCTLSPTGEFGMNFFYGAVTPGYPDPRPTTFSVQVIDAQGRWSAPASVVLP